MVEKKKSIATLSIVLSSLVLISFCTYWFLRFYDYIPKEGTSTASISALWGQFIVSLIFVFAIIVALIFLDRRVDTKFYKLFSFWIFVLLILVPLSYYTYKDISYGNSNTYQLGEPFDFNGMQYSVSKNVETIPYTPSDCSKYTDGIFDAGKTVCEIADKINREESQDNNLYVVNIDSKNLFGKTLDTPPHDFFVLRDSEGKITRTHNDNATFNRPIMPQKEVRIVIRYKILKVDVGKTYILEIKNKNKAPQYVEIK